MADTNRDVPFGGSTRPPQKRVASHVAAGNAPSTPSPPTRERSASGRSPSRSARRQRTRTNFAEKVKELEDTVAALTQKLRDDMSKYHQLSEAMTKLQQQGLGRKTAEEKYTNDVTELKITALTKDLEKNLDNYLFFRINLTKTVS